MLEWPILAAAAIGIDAFRKGQEPGEDFTGDTPMPGNDQEFNGWRFPVTDWNGYRAVVSDTYSPVVTSGHRKHAGVDMMFPRKAGGGADQQFARGTSEGSANYFMPSNAVIARAPRAGVLWSTGFGPTGGYVVIDCGAPIAIFMVHFSSLLVPSGIVRGAGKVRVRAGQDIAIVGHSPRDGEKLNHLHMEVWRGGGSESHVDPKPYLKLCTY